MVHGQQRACMPVYIGKSGDLVGCYRFLTYRQTSEYRATQLVSSIKHKLSHAICVKETHNLLSNMQVISSDFLSMGELGLSVSNVLDLTLIFQGGNSAFFCAEI